MSACETAPTNGALHQNGDATCGKMSAAEHPATAPADLQSLMCTLYDEGAVKFGSFKLKSGMDSPVYFDLRVMVSHPKLMCTVSELLWSKVAHRRDEFSSVCGVPYNALPLATLISVEQDIPMLIRRKEVKTYGTKRAVEGLIVEGARCLIIEDVISSGGSVLETVASLEKEGIVVELAVVLLNREQGGERNLRERGITCISVLKMGEMMDILYSAGKVTSSEVEAVQKYIQAYASDPVPLSLPPSLTLAPKPHTSYNHRISPTCHPLSARLLSIMEGKKTNLAFSADVHTSKKLLELADAIGPHICMLKTHADIMTDFTMETAQNLKTLATQHNFIIMEDRKFSDIGNTVQLQYTSPLLHLSSGWAGLVTSHALPGPGVIEGLKGVAVEGSGCVVVVEMSSQENLTNSEYTKGAVGMAIAHPEFVVGVVCRQRPPALPPSMVAMTPGVKLLQGTDSLGQDYITPEKAIGELGSDIIIVGRGIYTAPNVVETAKEYKERGFAAYLQRMQEEH